MDNSYIPGTILKIKARNFVSYGKLKFKPDHTLNILIAPNGAGKSSLLSAIILGLGGKPGVIGKSNQISDFIMYGKDEAQIEIDLFDPESEGNKLTVSRLIKRSGTSGWGLNQKKVSQKQVDDAMKRLNIQVDNLCQVLPQERVQDFAKMNSLQLLDNIQKALGGDLHCEYSQLKEHRISIAEMKESIEKKTQLRLDEINKYQRLEKDVAAIEEKKKILKSVTHCRQKLAWKLYKDKEEEQNKITGYLSEAKKKLATFEKDLEPLRVAVNSLERTNTRLNESIQKKKSKVNVDKDKLRQLMNEIKSSNSHIVNIKETLARRLSDESNHAAMVSNIENKIQELARLLAQENDKELTLEVTRFDKAIKEKNTEFQLLVQQVNQIRHEQVSVSNTIRVLESKLERASSVNKKRLQLITSQNQDVYKSYMWLSQNRNIFQANIYGPILMELNISNPQGAMYIEFIIPFRDLISFVTETSQDMKELLRLLRDKEQLTVNCAHCLPPNDALSVLFPPRYPIEQIRHLGFDCYLNDFIEGPETVIKHLCNLFKLHLIPVAFNSARVDRDAVARYNISAYFIGDEFCRVKTSRYSKQTTTSVVKVNQGVFLVDSIDKRLIQQTQIELNSKREVLGDLEEEMASQAEGRSSLEAELNDLRNQKKARVHRLDEYRSTTVRLRKHEEERSKLIKNMVDKQKEEGIAQSKIKEILNHNRVRMDEVLTWAKSYNEDSIGLKLTELDYNKCRKARDKKRRELAQHEEGKQKLKGDVEELRRSVGEIKVETSNLLSKAKELTEGLEMGDPKFTKAFAKHFSKLPDDIEAVKAKIHSFEAKARCLHNALQEQVLAEYDSAKKLSESLEVELLKLNEQFNIVIADFNKINLKWLPQIEQYVSQLNNRFSTFFSRINCVGEVSLDKGEDAEAVEKFGLQIRVKFRNDMELQVLDQYVQSGGERALTTAVFLLSLQRLSTLPFRCVDEINQGMDRFNERRVYNLLFNTISDATSQYFLLTPKFLKNLSFPKMCSIVSIFNCPIQQLPKRRSHEIEDNDKENNNSLKRRKREKYESNSQRQTIREINNYQNKNYNKQN